jgi:hypothetical protein
MPPLALSAPPKKRKSTKTQKATKKAKERVRPMDDEEVFEGFSDATSDEPVALTKTQKRKARAARTAAKYAERSSIFTHNQTSETTSSAKVTGLLDMSDSEDFHTERANAHGDDALDEGLPSDEYDDAVEFDTPQRQPRNDLAVLLAMVPRVRKVANRNDNTVQTRVTWTKAKAHSSTNDDEGSEQTEDDKSPTASVRRSSRHHSTPSEDEPAEDGLENENPDPEEQGHDEPDEEQSDD